MSINFTLFAQNSTHDYVKQAYLCAMSIRATNPGSKICLITDTMLDKKTASVFDDIVDIPWNDQAASSEWKIENRWKIYHATPYDQTIVLDTDMLVLDNIATWWNLLQSKDVYFTTNALTYRGDPVTSIYYRKAFKNHELPNLYAGFHYFKKNDNAHVFFKWLEIVMNNWELFYGQFAGGKYFQQWPSVDVSAAIVTKILDMEDAVTSQTSFPNFVHMKTHCQDWKTFVTDKWQDKVKVYLDNNLTLKIGNYKQSGIFHYTEKDFVTDDIIKIYEDYLGVHNE
jgi:hypothetical protein